MPLVLYSLFCFGDKGESIASNRPFYFGLIGGYGSTTWEGLVPTKNNQNSALNLSTPIKVTEGGSVWGLLTGIEFLPAFAIEVNYLNYSDAKVVFDSTSLFSFEHNDLLTLNTKTETLSLMAKVMLPIANTAFRLYSSAGAAGIHRSDIVINDWRLSPTFGLGLNYRLSEHLMAELGGNYTAGYGESQLSPADSFYPFLYSVTARLAFRF
ncbi:MAG: outer membrane beta-barrel protein [Tatlockia sp.]|nr:outer membrane beta-barrel protein [Tatlockia sp.]